MNRLASQMNDSARGIRWTYLTAFALFASLSVLGLLVYLTPMEELEKSQSTNPNEPLPSKPTIESQHFVLPDATNALSTEKLQEELRNAAQVLVSDFPNDPAAYHVAAMIHSELRQTKKAVELWEQCLAMGNLDAGPVVGLAGLLIDQGDEEKGAELLSKLEDPSVRTAEYYLKLSQAYSSMGELVKAEEVVREGLRRFSTDAGLWGQLGTVSVQLRQFTDAEASFRKAIELGDQKVTTLNSLVAVLSRLGKKEEADRLRSSQEQTNSLGKDSEIAPNGEVRVNEDKGFQDQYRKALHRLSVPLLRNASAVALANHRSELAERWGLLAMAEDPSNGELYMDLSSVYRKSNQYEKALVVHEKLLELQPANPYNYINLASVAMQLRRVSQAETILITAMEKFPTIPFFSGELAKIAMARGNMQQLEQYAKKASALDPLNVEWVLLMAMAARQSGRMIDCENYLRKANELAPNDPRVMELNLSIKP